MYCIVNIRQGAMHGKSRFSGKTAVRGRDLLAGRGFRGRDFSLLGVCLFFEIVLAIVLRSSLPRFGWLSNDLFRELTPPIALCENNNASFWACRQWPFTLPPFAHSLPLSRDGQFFEDFFVDVYLLIEESCENVFCRYVTLKVRRTSFISKTS